MKIGIIGGGQLALMLCESAKLMNHKTIVLDPSLECPAKSVCDELIIGNYDDALKLKELKSKSDIITYEFENIKSDKLEIIEDKMPQTKKPLYISQNRLREKTKALEVNIKTPKFKRVTNEDELNEAIKEIKYPCVLKTTELGYDGKGQCILKSEKDILKAKELLNVECILEQFIKFDYEISVIVIKNAKGQTITFPPGLNNHINNILHKTEELVNKEIADKAKQTAISFANSINTPGIIAVELFVKDNDVYFNEFAPRPHNSGHHTIEACNYSQFDMHLKAILNEDLEEIKITNKFTMVNILGQDYEKALDFVKNEKFSGVFHDYYKSEIRHNRKMAHITFTNDNKEDLEDQIKNFKRWTSHE